MEEQLPKAVVQERFDRLVALQEAVSLRKNEEQLGRTVELLVEGSGRKGGVQGRTRTNKVVNFDGTQRPGQLVDVTITGAHPHHLTGRAVGAGSRDGEAVAVRTG
jgi:tRNA-2-methylthio-N6-dimethylallyladenosine synthase